eukprot:Skav213062  [mRNA]  locus=scaffold364:558040:559530:- [translate_table: standard]
MRRPAHARLGALRRPSVRREDPMKSPSERWQEGLLVEGHEFELGWLKDNLKIVVEEAKYYHRDCRVAAVVMEALSLGPTVKLRVRPIGTTDEAILKLQSGVRDLKLRAIFCPPHCTHEETADDLIHVIRLRRMKEEGEEGWTTNLEKVAPAIPVDELAGIREAQERSRGEAVRPGADRGASPAKAKEKDGKDEKKEKKKRKKSKEKEENKKDRKKGEEESSGEEKIALDGTKPRAAAVKPLKTLYGGTGMDPKSKVRLKVKKLARKAVKKRGKASSSSKSSRSSGSSPEEDVQMGDSVFQQATRVRTIAEHYPGLLASEALMNMRSHLLQGIGVDEETTGVQPIALQYYRQVLHGRVTGPQARELLTLTATLDLLARGKPAAAMDVVAQRIKSSESTLGGTHWSVSQKLEVVPVDHATLTVMGEMKDAQREAYEESKLRWRSSLPDGRAQGSQKGSTKGKGNWKEDQRKGDSNRKGGKGQSGKGEPWKKKDDQATK